MKKTLFRVLASCFVVLLLLAGIWWVATTPPDHLRVGPPFVIGEAPDSIMRVKAPGDPIAEGMYTMAEHLGGYDDVVLQEELGRAFLTGRDGWIWQVDLNSGEAERVVDVPLMAAGAHGVPGDDDRICFCASYLYDTTYPESEQVGLYELRISTKTVTPLLLRVPLPPPVTPPRDGNMGTVFGFDAQTPLAVDEMDDSNSRPIAFCNDLTMSSDGKRIYFSEPFSYEGASMGGGAMGEAITLGKNGRLWHFNRETHTAALVAQNYNFIDGVLVEENADGPEKSILVTETTKFRILRFHLRGELAGRDEVVWKDLPSMPDALERDSQGRIWVGMIKKRSGLLTWAHAHPWIKHLLLRLPLDLLPVPTTTAFMALSPDASTPLFYTEHPGTHVHDIAAAVAGEKYVYLANFSDETPGLHRIPNPLYASKL